MEETEAEKQTAGIGKGTPGPGRPKGVPNKATRAAKEAIALAFDGIGGAARLTAWVTDSEKNEYAFWTQIYPKLIPVTLAGDPDNPLGHTVSLSAATSELLQQVSPGGSGSGVPGTVPD